jgi:hypothetical protein
MVQEDTCSTTKANDCERNESVTFGSSHPRSKSAPGVACFSVQSGKKGRTLLTLLAFRRARPWAGPTVGLRLFSRGSADKLPTIDGSPARALSH